MASTTATKTSSGGPLAWDLVGTLVESSDRVQIDVVRTVGGGSGGRGGHLCVEGSEHGTVWVCNTHDRIARVDGRFVHWVRGYGGGDRYSLIWYSTDPRDATRVAKPVHTAWRPAGGIVPFVYAD